MALKRDVHILNTAMDIGIALGLTKSCLSSSCRSSDYVLKAAERAKFGKDKKVSESDLIILYDALCLSFFEPLGHDRPSFVGGAQRICHDHGDKAGRVLTPTRPISKRHAIFL